MVKRNLPLVLHIIQNRLILDFALRLTTSFPKTVEHTFNTSCTENNYQFLIKKILIWFITERIFSAIYNCTSTVHFHVNVMIELEHNQEWLARCDCHSLRYFKQRCHHLYTFYTFLCVIICIQIWNCVSDLYHIHDKWSIIKGRARNWPRPIVRDDQQSGKDEFSFTELVLPDECSCLTIIRKDKCYFREGLVNFLASCPTGQVGKFSPISSPERPEETNNEILLGDLILKPVNIHLRKSIAGKQYT